MAINQRTQKLNKLRQKKKKRADLRDRALRRWKKEKKRRDLKEFRKHRRATRFLSARIDAVKTRYPASGTGAWAGSKSIIVNEVRPIARMHSVKRTSSKRGVKSIYTILNPGSDHSVLSTSSFADDYGTYDGAQLAHDIASNLGITGYSTGNYNSYYITRRGKTYRVQILWGVKDHWNHVHVGIRRVS